MRTLLGANPRLDYTKGIWTSIGTTANVPNTIKNNPGIVGIGVGYDWDLIEQTQGVYDWTQLDLRVANAKAAGFKNIVLQITWSPFDSPNFGYDSLQVLDVGEDHNTFCQYIDCPLYWDVDYHAARLALIAAAGERYSGDRAIKATFCSFMTRSSMDWGTFTEQGIVQCPICPQPPPTQCGPQIVDQVQDLLDAGWDRGTMLQIGKEIVDAVAEAFPHQNLKLPIGNLDTTLAQAGPPDPLGGSANTSTLAREITDYVYGNQSLGIPRKSYANRFYISRNTFAVPSPTGPELIANPPPVTSQNYVFKMVLDHANTGYLQTVDAASKCHPLQTCRQNGSQPCVDARQVMHDTLFGTDGNGGMLSYETPLLEIFTQDGQNVDFYDIISDATTQMGGKLRF